MRIADCSGEVLVELVEQLSDIRHDLGKYICFETRFAGADADTETLRMALKADLLATRRRGEQTETAWSLWERLRPEGLLEPEIETVDGAMEHLNAIDLDGPEETLVNARQLAQQVSSAIRALHGRAVQQQDSGLEED